jgi:hypothetical protein
MVGGRLAIENNPLAVADDLSIDAAYWNGPWKADEATVTTGSYQGGRNSGRIAL